MKIFLIIGIISIVISLYFLFKKWVFRIIGFIILTLIFVISFNLSKRYSTKLEFHETAKIRKFDGKNIDLKNFEIDSIEKISISKLKNENMNNRIKNYSIYQDCKPKDSIYIVYGKGQITKSRFIFLKINNSFNGILKY